MSNYPKREDLRLIALDLDGTVICSKGESPISERTKQAVRSVQSAGIPVTFVTGRTEDYAAPIALDFLIETPLVTYNGARVVSLVDSHVLYQSTVDTSVAASLCQWLQERDEVVACYLNRQGKLHLVQSRCSGRPAHDDHLFGTPRFLVESLSEEIGRDQSEVSKLIVSTQRPLAQEILERFGPIVQAVRTHEELVEILPLGVSKGNGVLRLCEILKIEPSRVLAIGDQENDISTFGICGYSVAMGDAPSQVREAAGFVTGTFAQDGCAQALERIITGLTIDQYGENRHG
jgi:5-amino-6-(5-phospho-D-ribitylamino)uracil phosphatase